MRMRALLSIVSLLAALGCQAILGIEEGEPRETEETAHETVRCGGDPCAVSDDTHCCYGILTSEFHCGTGTCNRGSLDITCDGVEDCADGQECCVLFNTSGQPYASSCVANCASVSVECTGSHNCPGDCCFKDTSITCVQAGACEGTVVCSDNADCPPGTTCELFTDQSGGPTSLNLCR
jgi:hypothetical protein